MTKHRIDPADIDRAKTVNLADIAFARGLVLKRVGAELTGGCPLCGGVDRFAISISKNVFNCRGCGGRGNSVSFLMWLDGCTFPEAVAALTGGAQVDRRAVNLMGPRPAPRSSDDRDRRQYDERAGRIWRASVDPRRTLAERYLNGRGIELADDLCGRVLRFHAACPWKDSAVPALIAKFFPITEPDDAAPPVAIMRVGLTADGSKIAKGMMLGPVAGCAIKLDADENVSHGLGITEGLETALKVRAMGWRPVWALGSAGAIETFPPLAGVDPLTIFGDNDESGRGIAAARMCAGRWADAGRESFIRMPHTTGADWADAT